MDDEEDDPPELQIVTKFFDGQVARILREDGSHIPAHVYQPGPNGFVVAKWVEEQEEFELEVPNTCCKDGVLQLGTATQPPVTRKPAGVKKEEKKEEAA